MKGEPKPAEAIRKYFQHTLGFIVTGESQHSSIRVTDQEG